MDIPTATTIIFDQDCYFWIETLPGDLYSLSNFGWREVTTEEIAEVERARIASDLAAGKMPFSLTEEQKAHNDKSMNALEEFINKMRKK